MSMVLVDGIVSLLHTLTSDSSLTYLIQRDDLDLFNFAHMGSFAPRFHDNRSEANPAVIDQLWITSPFMQSHAPPCHHANGSMVLLFVLERVIREN